MPRPSLAAWCVCAGAIHALAPAASAQLRTVTWNVAKLQGDPGAIADVLAETMQDDRPGFAVAPHVFVFQEVQADDTGPLLNLLQQAAPPGTNYALATYTTSGSEDAAGGAQALYYRTDALVELAAFHRDLFTGAGRNADRWRLDLLGYDDEDARLWVYSAHLKASPGATNEAERLAGAQALRADVATLGPAAHVLLAGDLNLYSNGEPAYAELLAAGAGRLFDPLGSGSWSGAGNAIKHTQSPRLANGSLIGGGVDDRFDFQLPSAELLDGEGLTLVADSYRAMGNDGQHYNDRIDAGNNFYYPGQIARSNLLAADLHDASDHLPVIVDWMLPARLAAVLSPFPDRVVEGAVVVLEVLVWNDAPAVVPEGAQPLIFSLAGSGDVFGSGNGLREVGDPPQSIVAFLDASAPGPAGGLATVSAIGEGTGNREVVLPVVVDVLRASRPSFAVSDDVVETVLEVTLDEGAAPQPLAAFLFNVGWDPGQARLDLDAVTIDGAAAFTFDGDPVADITVAPVPLLFTADPGGLAPGTYETIATVATSDEDLPGEGARNLQVTLRLVVESTGGDPADLDGDGSVGFGDLLVLLSAWGPCPAPPDPCPADLDGGGSVDFADILALLSSWS